MASFKGKTISVSRPVGEVYARVSNLGEYQQYVDKLPEEVKHKVGGLRFGDDTLVITAPVVGEITLRVVKREEPSLVSLETENSPVPMFVNLHMAAAGADTTELTPAIDIDVPPMMRAMVGPKLQEAADKLGDMLGNLLSVNA